MMLENKVAVVYGAGGAIGGAVARAFAREGAKLFLSGRRRARVDAVANEVIPARSRKSSGFTPKRWGSRGSDSTN